MASTHTTPKQRSNMFKERNRGWRESLKERCKSEIKSRRHNLLAQLRECSLNGEGGRESNSTLDDIMYTQFLALRRELHFDDLPGSEEEVIRILEEVREELLMEQGLRDQGDFFFDEIVTSIELCEVICPICQRNNLMKHPTEGVIRCPCGLDLGPRSRSVELHQVNDALTTAAELHSSRCRYIPLFVTEEEAEGRVRGGVSIVMRCNYCEFVYNISR